jgi:hypothetical protein
MAGLKAAVLLRSLHQGGARRPAQFFFKMIFQEIKMRPAHGPNCSWGARRPAGPRPNSRLDGRAESWFAWVAFHPGRRDPASGETPTESLTPHRLSGAVLKTTLPKNQVVRGSSVANRWERGMSLSPELVLVIFAGMALGGVVGVVAILLKDCRERRPR